MRRRTMVSGGVDYERYLKFTATQAGTFQFSGTGISYSLNNGSTWTSLAANTATPTVASGSSIMWKGTMTPSSSSGIGTFSSTGNFTAEGNPMCLLFGDEFEGETDLTGKNYAFYRLFSGCTGIVSVENLILPATTLAQYCYSYMFENCTGLTSIPSNLLHATTLANHCYGSMFMGCTKLTTIPSGLLPATTLASTCYGSMFRGCTKLTTIPSGLLPATTLASSCYAGMFYGCTSLETAPDLPAATLPTACYNNMFNGCSSLNYIKCLATSKVATSLNNWVLGVASTGTFVKAPNMAWGSGKNGVPSGWTVEIASS